MSIRSKQRMEALRIIRHSQRAAHQASMALAFLDLHEATNVQDLVDGSLETARDNLSDALGERGAK